MKIRVRLGSEVKKMLKKGFRKMGASRIRVRLAFVLIRPYAQDKAIEINSPEHLSIRAHLFNYSNSRGFDEIVLCKSSSDLYADR